MKAVKCPVCAGTGKIWIPDSGTSTACDAHWQPCHGCNGTGWV